MGSLMSGWSSTVLGDDKKVRLMRNRSLTKEDVDAFWRQHGMRPDNNNGHHQSSSPLGSPRVVSSALPSPRRSTDELRRQESPLFEAERLDAIRSLPPSPLAPRGAGSSSSSHHDRQHFSSRSKQSSSSSPAARADGFPDSPSMSCDWWTRSSWAFLNEPPRKQQEEVISMSGRGRAQHKPYACDQFHVARIVTGNA